MNYGKLISWVSVGLSFGACVGYAWAGDWRRTAYFFFAACITASVIL